MSTGKQRTYSRLIAFLLILTGFGLLGFLALNTAQVRCLGVAEALALTGNSPELIQVVGAVGSLQPDALAQKKEPQKTESFGQSPFATTDSSSQPLSFTLLDRQDKNKKITVLSSTSLPPSLREGGDVFVTGHLDKARQTLNSTEIITKCPTKYQNKNAP